MNKVQSANPTVLLVGGPDVDARIPLILRLKHKYTFMVAGSQHQPTLPFEQAGIDFYPYYLHRGTNPLQDLRTINSLLHLFKQHHFDLVHTFDTKPNVWGRIAAWLANVPIIVGTVPGLGTLYSNEEFYTRLARKFYQPLQKIACTTANVTIFQNEDDRQHFVDLGITPIAKTMLIRGSGVDSTRFNPSNFTLADRHLLRKEIGIPPTATVITMVARLIRSKGVLEFAQAARKIKAQFPDVYFLLVGPVDGNGNDKLTPEQLITLQASVNWIGPRPDIPAILNASDIFTLPSNYREGIPRVLLEAASMALPTVTTNSPGCNKVVLEGMTGLLISDRDPKALVQALTKLIQSTPLRIALGKTARQHVKANFELSIIAQETDNLYQHVLIGTQQLQRPLTLVESQL